MAIRRSAFDTERLEALRSTMRKRVDLAQLELKRKLLIRDIAELEKMIARITAELEQA